MGGSVGDFSSPEMDLYNQVTMELESGGVSGYAHGGMVEKSREIASKGRNGDTMLMHIQPQELEGLQSLLGPVTINPETGNPEAFAWFAALPLLGKLAVGALGGGALGAGIGGIVGGKEGALKGLAMGSMLGTGAAGLGAAAGGAAPATAVSTSSFHCRIERSADPHFRSSSYCPRISDPAGRFYWYRRKYNYYTCCDCYACNARSDAGQRVNCGYNLGS
jgi:hypothetical protein